MAKIIIQENQLVNLIETAMDLDRYVEPNDFDVNNGNIDIQQSIKDTVDKLNELLYMFESGKKTLTDYSGGLFKLLDDANELYEKIKYND